MNAKRYDVVFWGEIAKGQDNEEVKERIAVLCKIPVTQCHQMFTGKVITVKKDVDAITAEKYKKAFEKTGAICRIKEIKPPPQKQSPQKSLNSPPQRSHPPASQSFQGKRGGTTKAPRMKGPARTRSEQATPQISEKQPTESMQWSIRLAQTCRSSMDRLTTWQIATVFFLLGECTSGASGLLLIFMRPFLPHSSFLPWLVTSVVMSASLFGAGWLSRSLREKSHVTNIRNIFLIIGIGHALFFALGPLLLSQLPNITARDVLSLAFWSFLVGLSVILCWKRAFDPFRFLSLITLSSVIFRLVAGRTLGVIFLPGVVFAFCAFAVSGSKEPQKPITLTSLIIPIMQFCRTLKRGGMKYKARWIIVILALCLAAASVVLLLRPGADRESATPPYQLRSEPITVSEYEALDTFDLTDRWRPRTYIENDYELETLQGDTVVLDYETELMWQQAGSYRSLTYAEAQEYINRLNRERFAGFDDWRLPTIPELLSLLKIDPIFDRRQSSCWSADRLSDKDSPSTAWVVELDSGRVCFPSFTYDVRAVRSWQKEDDAKREENIQDDMKLEEKIQDDTKLEEKTRSDMRVIAFMLGSYQVDYDVFPKQVIEDDWDKIILPSQYNYKLTPDGWGTPF